MKYFFIEYISNDMITGDWEWYLNNYNLFNDLKKSKEPDFEIQVFEISNSLNGYNITATEFNPMSSTKFIKKVIPAPPDVRWGVELCFDKSLIHCLGADLLKNNFILGKMKTNKGGLIDDIYPVRFLNFIEVENDDMSVSSHLRKINNEIICSSERFQIIIREDYFYKISKLPFRGCKIIKK